MCNSQCAMKVSAFADDSEWASPMIHHRGAILPLRIPHCKKLSLFPVMYCRGTPLERRRCAPGRSFADRKEVMTLTDRQILRLLQSRDETALRELTAEKRKEAVYGNRGKYGIINTACRTGSGGKPP